MKGHRGLTLIEVVVVLAIIAISIGLAGPRIGAGLGGLELRQSEQTVKTYLRLAKARARRADSNCYVVLDNVHRTVGLLGPDMNLLREQKLPSSVSFILKPPLEKVALRIAPSGIVGGDSVRLRGRTAEVEVSVQ